MPLRMELNPRFEFVAKLFSICYFWGALFGSMFISTGNIIRTIIRIAFFLSAPLPYVIYIKIIHTGKITQLDRTSGKGVKPLKLML